MRQVVDASVVLAYLRDEPGGDVLVRDGGPFCLSSVNLTEILTKIVDLALSPDDVLHVLKRMPFEHFDHGRDHALRAARLRAATRHYGLSLGDRACLALANVLHLPVLTADRKWIELDLGIDVRLIR